MVDVIISCPSEAAFIAQMSGQAKGLISVNPVRDGVLGDTMYFRSDGLKKLPKSIASISKYRVPYRTVDAVFDKDGNETSPAQFSPNITFYIRMSEVDWNSLLASANPTGRLKGAGGAKVDYAYGLTVDPGIGNGDGTWGTAPSNGIQMVWA